MRQRDDHPCTDEHPPGATTTARDVLPDRSVSRRGFLAAAATTASAGLAGCGGRVPNGATTVDATTRRDDGTLTWEYPARAVRGDPDSDGIGYAAIRFEPFDRAWDSDRVLPGLGFRLNSTVGTRYAGEGFRDYQADWFRFRIGVPRSYDGGSGFRAFVEPNQWPELSTTYGYEGATRELVVMAPAVNTDGTITVAGQFRSADATLPRQLLCGFAVQASQPGALGRTVTVDGRASFDVSTLDLPDGVRVG